MAKFSVDGSIVTVTDDLNIRTFLDKLPVATYMLSVSPQLGFYLSRDVRRSCGYKAIFIKETTGNYDYLRYL